MTAGLSRSSASSLLTEAVGTQRRVATRTHTSLRRQLHFGQGGEPHRVKVTHHKESSNKANAPSPFFHVVDGQRHAPAAVQGRGDVDGVEALRLPHVLHRPQEVPQNLAGQHLLHVHVLDVELGLVGQRELCEEAGVVVKDAPECSTPSLSALTFCSHDVYDQVVPRRLKSASVVGRNLQNTGEV